ncbi:DUF4432 family protein [Galbitalea sp. SE-J8]|uniref:DUF4432 family protein n=1 Tax=Galbitalea sp. SE-J8 TaxID=3054952 RepID=UPI00259C9C17|nr:DUF4432 family protein [Galbitalea sp. SE-J8]MDM4762050.1 DUF4432 family protein [Galbitalea sp. SE-J8]
MSAPSPTAAALLRDGLVARIDALAEVAEHLDPAGRRIVSVRLAGGWAFDVLPDRGLDIGSAWWGRTPIAWRSPLAVDPGAGSTWEHRFLGGLLATCGTENIGPARDDAGEHGSHHLTPATDVRVVREIEGDALRVRVLGRVESTRLYGRRIVVEREISARTDDAAITVRDTVRNAGAAAEPVALLYHVNIGAPVLHPGTTVDVAAERSVQREPVASVDSPGRMPEPSDVPDAAVFEHVGVATADGTSRVVVRPPGAAPALAVEWSSGALPRLFEWMWPSRGAWALGIEPANAPLFGPERASAHAGAPPLAAGASIATELRISALE